MIDQSLRPYTPAEFAMKYLCYRQDARRIVTLQDLWSYMDAHPDDEHWDYPILEELAARENSLGRIVMVVEPGTCEGRWFETVPTTTYI